MFQELLSIFHLIECREGNKFNVAEPLKILCVIAHD